MGVPDEMWPWTLEELIAADMLLGVPEAEARALWTAQHKHAERAWQDYLAHQDEPGRAFGLLLGTEMLVALSLVSGETAARVEELRRLGWEGRLAAVRTGLISPQELERLREEKRLADEEWEREREALRRKIEVRGRGDQA